MKNIFIICVWTLLLMSCSDATTSTTSTISNLTGISAKSDLLSLNLKGEVVRLEVITQTTIPVSEWFFSGVDFNSYSTHCRKDAIYTFVGNSSILFDERGRVSSQIVYNNDGTILFNELPDRNENLSLYQPINISVNELFDGWNFEYDENLRVIRQTTTHEGKMFLDRKVYYNACGDIDYVTCDYLGSSIKMKFSPSNTWTHTLSDTTFFAYKKYDDKGNWTDAVIWHKGNHEGDSYVMNVRRQLTYKYEPLIKTLELWNKEIEKSSSYEIPSMVTQNFFNSSLCLQMPQELSLYMSNDESTSFVYRFQKHTDGFFSLTITKEQKEENIFELDPTQEYLEATSYMLGCNGVVVLKWFDYSNRVMINNNRCVTMKYAFYATGGYLSNGDPIITELMMFQPDSRTLYTIAIGYDSYHENLYQPWAEKIKNSIIIK